MYERFDWTKSNTILIPRLLELLTMWLCQAFEPFSSNFILQNDQKTLVLNRASI